MSSLLGWLVCALTLVFVAGGVKETSELMSHITAHFGLALEECREEAGLSSDIIEEFHHLWRDDFDVVHRELGCAIICMSRKFQLLQDDARLHHVNMHDYIKSFPEGEALSSKIVNLIHDCEKQFDDIDDNCSRVVKVFSCFKKIAREAGIAPEIALIETLLEKYA